MHKDGGGRAGQGRAGKGREAMETWVGFPKIFLKGTPQFPNFLSPVITSSSFYNFE